MILNESEFSNEINICTQWYMQKVSMGDLKFCRSDVMPQINIMESAKGQTIVGWSGGSTTTDRDKLMANQLTTNNADWLEGRS